MKEFRNKVALITGAGNGFGQEFAKEACRRGMGRLLSAGRRRILTTPASARTA